MYRPYRITEREIRMIVGPLSAQTDYINQYENELFSLVDESVNMGAIENSIIDGSQLEEDWFPIDGLGEFAIFLSHSHQDFIVAELFAIWLYQNLGLRCFVDSIYWRHADSLLREIDKTFCGHPTNDGYLFDYEKRNQTTANVHIMLSMALMKMIDITECIIFIDSRESLIRRKGKVQTSSPWIYEEVNFANMLNIRHPIRELNERKVVRSGGLKSFSDIHFHYNMELDKFNKLSANCFRKVLSMGLMGDEALNYIYYNF